MKCEGCGAELAEGTKTCAACGHPVTLGQRTEAGAERAAEKTGEVAGKVGRGVVNVGKGLGAGLKKGFKSKEDEKQS